MCSILNIALRCMCLREDLDQKSSPRSNWAVWEYTRKSCARVVPRPLGDVPVGAYDSTRLSNIGIGHGAIRRRRRLHLSQSADWARVLGRAGITEEPLGKFEQMLLRPEGRDSTWGSQAEDDDLEYYINEAQTLLICMLADTDQVVREIIDRSKPAATSTRLS